jgi:hypothetical protein
MGGIVISTGKMIVFLIIMLIVSHMTILFYFILLKKDVVSPSRDPNWILLSKDVFILVTR